MSKKDANTKATATPDSAMTGSAEIPAVPAAEPAATPIISSGGSGGAVPAPVYPAETSVTTLTTKPPGIPQERVDQIIREKWDARRRVTELETELNALKTAQATRTLPDSPAAEGFEAMVNQKAQELAIQQRFNDRCNEVYQEAKTLNPDFDNTLGTLAQMFGPLTGHTQLVGGIISQKNAANIFDYLGKHPGEAERIFAATGPLQLVEIGKLSERLALTQKGPSLSRAPAPTVPVTTASPSLMPQPSDSGSFKSQAEYRQWRANLKSGHGASR